MHGYTIPWISSRPLTGLALFSNSSTNPWTVLSIPFFIETGFAPEVTLKRPNLMISRARTDAVVVPSPAESLVLLATYTLHQKQFNISMWRRIQLLSLKWNLAKFKEKSEDEGPTSLMRAAPAFSIASGSSIARAIVTPSFTTLGLPNSSKTTFLPSKYKR